MNHPCHNKRWDGAIKLVIHDWGPWTQEEMNKPESPMKRVCLKSGCGMEQIREKISSVDKEGKRD